MEVAMIVKFNTPKEPERNKKRYEFMAEYNRPYYDKKVKEGVKWKASGWSNGSGTVIGWHEFETLEDFNKVWGDEEFQKIMARWSYFVDNCEVQVLWPSKSLPPK